MSTFLFVTWDGGGNVPPALGIARELHDRGHTVRVLGHATQARAVEGAGLRFEAYRHTEEFTATGQHTLSQLVALFSDRALGSEVVETAGRSAVDLVVVDCLLVGVLHACLRAGVRYATLEHLFDGYLRGGWLHGPVGVLARLRGARPAGSWAGTDAAVVATLPSLDPGRSRARRPDNRHWTGPVLATVTARSWAGAEPAVLVSLSTFNYPGMGKAMQRLLDALAGAPYRVVVTTGPVLDPADLRVPAGIEIHRWLPHDEVMPQVSLVVTHGGHATAMRALAHDLPMVVLPMHPLLDQRLVGRQVAAAGAGALVSRRDSADRLRAVVDGLVGDGPHRAAAARLGAEIRATGGASAAADLLAGVADRRSLSPGTTR